MRAPSLSNGYPAIHAVFRLPLSHNSDISLLDAHSFHPDSLCADSPRWIYPCTQDKLIPYSVGSERRL